MRPGSADGAFGGRAEAARESARTHAASTSCRPIHRIQQIGRVARRSVPALDPSCTTLSVDENVIRAVSHAWTREELHER